MLRQTVKTGFALLALAGTALSFSSPAEARKAQHHDIYRSKPVTIAIVSNGAPRVTREISQYLRDYLPHNTRLIRQPRRADYVIQIKRPHVDTDLRVRHKDDHWTSAHRGGHKRFGIYGQRIGWTEVSAIAFAQYDMRIVLKNRYGNVVDRDRLKGRVRENVRWGEDLRVSTPRGYRPVNRYPDAHVQKLFAQAPGTGQGPRAQVLDKLAHELAHKIVRQTLPQLRYAAYKDERGYKGHKRSHRYHREPFNPGRVSLRLK
ncbi:MAG: hypothetical protein PVF65_07830 [Sphingomonadales bacterium]|jgi:hypothetical protein